MSLPLLPGDGRPARLDAPAGRLLRRRRLALPVDLRRLAEAVERRDEAAPLHFAAKRGDVAVALVLLDEQADPALRNRIGETALDYALDELGDVQPILAKLFPEVA